MASKKKPTKNSALKINNVVLKRIKEYPKVTRHRENDCERRLVYNSTRIRSRRSNISKSY